MRFEKAFVRIGAEWTCTNALAMLGRESARAPRVVVHERGTRDRFWLIRFRDVTVVLDGKGAKTVGEALELDKRPPTPVAPSVASRPIVDSIVVDGGVIAGVFVTPEPPKPDPPEIKHDDQPGLEALHPHTRGAVKNGQKAAPAPRGLKARVPSHITVGKTASLIVEIANEITKNVMATFDASAGDEILVVVVANGPIEVVGDEQVTLVVDDAKPPAHPFQIRGLGPGEAVISVDAFIGKGRVASVTVTTMIHAVDQAATEVEANAELEAPVAECADLDILIIEDKPKQRYRLIVHGRTPAVGVDRAMFEFKLGEDVDAYFATFFADIEDTLKSNLDTPIKLQQLRTKGNALALRILPEELRDLLWSMRATKKVRTISIQSEEPWVPWELCRLSGKENGKFVEGLFLAEEFVVTRWLPRVKDVKSLTLSSIGLVVPPDSGLIAAKAETGYVQSLAGQGREVIAIEPSYLGVHAALDGGTHDGLHFTGHGKADAANADRSFIRLEGDTQFRPEDISGAALNFGLKHPLVILNACQIARAGTVLGGLGGWPQAFVRNGAGAFIGPYWNIDDGKASAFAQAVYSALIIEGKTVPEAVHAARAEIQTSNDPTWLAYVVYSHPDAKLA